MIQDICKISMTDDDKYILEVTEKEKKSDKGEKDMCKGNSYKNYVANDYDELFELLKKHVPKIKTQPEKDKDAYKKGWKKDEHSEDESEE